MRIPKVRDFEPNTQAGLTAERIHNQERGNGREEVTKGK